jgi:predicted nucleotidyltransferase
MERTKKSGYRKFFAFFASVPSDLTQPLDSRNGARNRNIFELIARYATFVKRRARITFMAEPQIDEPKLEEIVRRLVKTYQPLKIYLFGSYARGDIGPDSDYDLLVIVPDDAPKELRRSRLAYQVLRGIGTAVDVLVCTRGYFEARLHLKASLPGTVIREGKLLHAA